MKFGPINFSWKSKPVVADTNPTVLLRLEYWLEFKRTHLAFLQTLNARTYGHSSTMALLQSTMLASHEIQRLSGRFKTGAPNLILGKPMRVVLSRCQNAYDRVLDKTFDDRALADIGLAVDAETIERFRAMTEAPVSQADQDVIQDLKDHRRSDTDRVERFTHEIANADAKLHETFREFEDETEDSA